MFFGGRIWRFFSLALLGALLLGAVACFGFGGGSGGAEFELMEFEETDTGEGDVEEVVFVHDVGVVPLVREEVNYLHRQAAWLERLLQLNRDMLALLEDSGGEQVGLEWVVQVHEITREADQMFALMLADDIPETQAPDHFEIHLGGVRAVQMMVYGSDRLLASALVLGPSGRMVGDMDVDEGVRFSSLSQEASFYLRDSERMVNDQVDLVQDSIGSIGLR